MDADENDSKSIGGADKDDSDLLEDGPFGVDSLRWTRKASDAAAVRTSINRSFGSYSPIYMSVYNDLFEVKPSRLYLELETLSLDEASDEAVRAYAALREQVVEDLKDAAWKELHEAMDKAREEE